MTSSIYARSLFELKNYDQASLAFDQSINNCKSEKIDEPIYYAGLTYFKLGKLSEATARFENLIASFPDGEYAEQTKSMLMLIKKK
jgi:outer membrane protein assembly factor BamD (BamD/ComL family)